MYMNESAYPSFPASAVSGLLRLRTRQLALLAWLDAERNLGRAAAALHVSQPAASKLLLQAEQALGATLFERHARGMVPTVHGEVVARYARRVLNGFGTMQEELSALREGLRGAVRIGSVPGAVPALLAPALAVFKRGHPHVAVSIEVGTSNHMIERLLRGEVDLVLGRPGSAEQAPLQARALLDEALVIVARKGHPLARHNGLPFARLVEAPWVLQPPGSPQRIRFEAALAQAGVTRKLDVTETASSVVTTALLAHSDMLAVMPASLAEHYGRLGVLGVLDTDFSMRVAPVYLLSAGAGGMSPAAVRLAAALCRHAGVQPPDGSAPDDFAGRFA